MFFYYCPFLGIGFTCALAINAFFLPGVPNALSINCSISSKLPNGIIIVLIVTSVAPSGPAGIINNRGLGPEFTHTIPIPPTFCINRALSTKEHSPLSTITILFWTLTEKPFSSHAEPSLFEIYNIRRYICIVIFLY